MKMITPTRPILDLIQSLIDVQATDPDDARRRELLNILLLGVGTLTLVLAVGSLFALGIGNTGQPNHIFQASLATLVGLPIIYMINRQGHGWVASLIFLMILGVVIAFADDPDEVAGGRSLFLFTIPIMMASVLLAPPASFSMAALAGLTIAYLDLLVNEEMVNLPAIAGFFAIALVSWLWARNLEQALKELRTINEELDQRVADRTRDLAEALGKNQAILESIADGVIVFDNDGQATLANPSIGRLLQRPLGEIRNSDIKTLMAGNVTSQDQSVITGLLKEKQKHHSALKIQWSHKTLSVSFAPVIVAPHNVSGTVAVFRDFTREAEVDHMKSTIVAMVSHDLRTPLNAVLGYAEMLQEAVYGSLNPKQHDAITRVTSNAKRLLSLVNDLLDQAQIEAGRLTLSITSFSPADLLEGVHSVMNVIAQAKGLELTSQLEANLPEQLQGDPQRLHQILVNLVGNSVKFTEQGSIHIHIYQSNAELWAIDVIDTGPGIPSDKIDRIFERFYQVDNLPTRKHSGIGLGLSIVQQLVNMMGGQIKVESSLGQGSTFSIRLPFMLNDNQDK